MIQPMNDFFLVEPIKFEAERDNKTKGGALIAREQKEWEDLVVARGTVIAVSTGYELDMPLQTVIYYNFFSGHEIVIPGKDPLGRDDKKYHFVHVDDVLGRETNE